MLDQITKYVDESCKINAILFIKCTRDFIFTTELGKVLSTDLPAPTN